MNNATWPLALETWQSLVTLTPKVLSSWTTLWHFIIDLHQETFQESMVSKSLYFSEKCLWGTSCTASQLPRHEHPYRYFSQRNIKETSWFWTTEFSIFKLLYSCFLLCISHQLPGTCIGTDFCVPNLLLAPSYFLFSFSWFLSRLPCLFYFNPLLMCAFLLNVCISGV